MGNGVSNSFVGNGFCDDGFNNAEKRGLQKEPENMFYDMKALKLCK